MRQIAFGTLKFAEKLISSGVPEKQAKAHVEALVEITQMNLDGLATKHDLQETENRLQHDLRETEARLKHDLRETEARLKHDLRETEARLDAKIDRVHDKLDIKIDHIHDKLDAKIDHVHDKLDSKIGHIHDKLVAKFNGKFKLLYWMFSITMAGIGTILAGIATLILK